MHQMPAGRSDFAHKSLQDRLSALSEQCSVPKAKLAARTTATFVGTRNFGNLMEWVWNHAIDPSTVTVFKQSES